MFFRVYSTKFLFLAPKVENFRGKLTICNIQYLYHLDGTSFTVVLRIRKLVRCLARVHKRGRSRRDYVLKAPTKFYCLTAGLIVSFHFRARRSSHQDTERLNDGLTVGRRLLSASDHHLPAYFDRRKASKQWVPIRSSNGPSHLTRKVVWSV